MPHRCSRRHFASSRCRWCSQHQAFQLGWRLAAQQRHSPNRMQISRSPKHSEKGRMTERHYYFNTFCCYHYHWLQSSLICRSLCNPCRFQTSFLPVAEDALSWGWTSMHELALPFWIRSPCQKQTSCLLPKIAKYSTSEKSADCDDLRSWKLVRKRYSSFVQ